MERIILVNCAVLCVAILLVGVVLSIPHYDNQIAVRNERSDDKKQSYLWFGPRLGRKKRNPSNEDPSLYRTSELSNLMDVIEDSPWAIVALNDGKRHTVNFTPRLGRESGEEFISSASGDRWLQDPEMSGELLSQRSPPFAPRLGRHLSPYSPRLGRDNDKNQL